MRARRVIHRQVDQLTRLVDDLLDLTRVSRGKVRLERETLDLDALLRQAVEDHASLFETSRVRRDCAAPAARSSSRATADGCSRWSGTCCRTRPSSRPAGGTVRVLLGIDASAARAVLRVEDTGVGMDAETLAALFSPYMQSEASRSHSRNGLGLGLSLVHSLVALHDGTVTASSAGSGKGTTARAVAARPRRLRRFFAAGARSATILRTAEVQAMEYRYGNGLDLEQVTELYRASTLGERRPIDDPRIVRAMLEHANLVVTAWDGQMLVGISRTLTDFLYVGYLADLAVRESHQRRGIGTELIEKTRERMGPRSMLVLLAAPKAVDYYPKIGFKRHDSAWILRASEPLAPAT